MDKRQLRQSAVADFMESLEQLNELWEGETDNVVWDNATQNSEMDRTELHPLTASCASLDQSPKSPHSEVVPPKR
ncbi:MAG: hypothetical protein AAGA83_23770 [Cyanobacteria bacterium P01_F01_bin.116]